MTEIEATLIHFHMHSIVLAKFQELITSDPELSGAGEYLLVAGMTLDNGCCVFGLEALFGWVVQGKEMSYNDFRSQLYQSDLNARLNKMGYTVEIKETTGKVDSNIYQLTKL